jgi:hypothetical protein
MWLCLERGFFSVIQYNNNIFVIRARKAEHLQEYFPNSYIFTSEQSDYRYRIFCDKKDFSQWLSNYVINLKDEQIIDTKLQLFFNKIIEASKTAFKPIVDELNNKRFQSFLRRT